MFCRAENNIETEKQKADKSLLPLTKNLYKYFLINDLPIPSLSVTVNRHYGV